MTSLENMDGFVLDELMDFIQASDELALPTALTLGDLDQNTLLGDTGSLFDSSVPDLLPLETIPTLSNIAPAPTSSDNAKPPAVATEQHRQRSKDAIRRSEYRKRQKAEKEALRREIDELSARLDKLQDAPGDGSLSPSTDDALSSCLWKAIASRQKDHRDAAEEEQLHLRAAITSRATLIEDLCGFLRKRVHDGSITNSEFEDAPRLQKRMRLEPTDSALFETFIQELHTVYLQTDEVTKACEQAETPSITKHKDGATEYYQHVERQTMPFKFQQTCNSVWHLAQLKHRQEDREIYEGVEDPENTMAMKFRVTSRRMGETVSLLQRVVVRRYQEISRVVVVWKVFTEGEELFRGMHSDETGWGVIRPSTTSDATGTILDTCFRNVPMHFSNSSTCTPVVNEFTDMVVRTGEEENFTVMKALEKMLLDDALADVIT
ncbi:hypothetical protein GN244_ATG12863 [Phytophthora infestans]|uniref:M96 mating-specific protein family n=1 Tax=Phytophthora infestans TaxID=4787 RepID=A0A833SKH0_PHYIN|nr:hypothetical protein GN244_ATG12863 [Phytophthora infestans]KAF4134734.1 hypothetical protein GN958_ATG15990 [Phytophthora infestans]